MRPAALRADGLILLVAAIWGSGFVAQRVAMESMGPFGFNAARYLVGALVVAPLALRTRVTRAELRAGIVLGVVMALAAGFQQAGIVTTTAARAGFITGLYVPVVPLIGLMIGQRIVAGHVLGGVLAVAGMALLAGDLSGGIAPGDALVMVCALMWAVHVVMVGRWAGWADPLRISLVQFVTVAVLSGAAAAVFEGNPARGAAGAGWAIAYSGVLVIGVAFTLQVVAQKTAPASHAAVLMSLEAVFAVVFGWALLGEGLGPRELAGAALMLAGMMTSQLWPHRRTEAERAELVDPVR